MATRFQSIVGKVKLRCPDAPQFLAEDWVRQAFSEISTYRNWSWLFSYSQFLIPAIYNTGTVTVTRGSTAVTGSSTVWTSDMVGRQFRIGVGSPIYTITQVLSNTALILDQPYGGTSDSALDYQIILVYLTPPSDFVSFISVWDPNFNWQLVTDFSQNELNAADAQRGNVGNAYVLAWRDYTTTSLGLVAQPVIVDGSGEVPGSSGSYSGPNDALFTIEITTGGAPGTAVFQWKKDDGSYTTGITTSAIGAAQALQDGVNVYFPTGVSYTLGDVYVISCQAGANPGTPRYEIWPYQTAQYAYPFLYWKKFGDIGDPSVQIPSQIHDALILERALASAAMWPGPTDKTNSYYRLELADRHMKKFDALLMEAERNDEEIFMTQFGYQGAVSMPFAPIPALGDSNWLQAHDW